MNKEERKTILDNFQYLDGWCRNAVEIAMEYGIFISYDNLVTFAVDENNITIVVCSNWSDGESEESEILEIPLDVYYNDNLKEYFDGLYEETMKKEEEKKKRRDDLERESAKRKIEELKKKYNL